MKPPWKRGSRYATSRYSPTPPKELPIACANSQRMSGLPGFAARYGSISRTGRYIRLSTSVVSGWRGSQATPS